MKNFLAVVGAVLLIACLWLGLITFQQGGIQQAGEDGGSAEVLTAEGWQPASGAGPALAQEEPDRAGGVDLAEAPPPTERPLPTSVPPTVFVPTLPPPPSPLPRPPTVIAVVEAPPRWDDGELPPGWDQDPTGASTYTAAPSKVSPWEVLGWVLVGLVPAGGLLAAGLVLYRQVVLIRAQAAVLQQLAATAPPPEAPVEEPFREKSPPADHPTSEQVVNVKDYLAGQDGGQEGTDDQAFELASPNATSGH